MRRATLNSRAGWMSLALALAASPAGAIVVQGGSMDRPDRAFIGRWGGSSAVAIGPRAVLTAAHVGGGPGGTFTLDDQSYRATATTRHASDDLMIVHLDADLPGWHEIAPSVHAGTSVILGGFGRTAGEASAGSIAWSDRAAEAWGRNIVDRSSRGLLSFDFDAARAGIEHEAAFAHFDSGGGVFVEGPDGSLLLAALAVGIDGPIGSSPFGSRSYAADLSLHQGFIAGIPSPGTLAIAPALAFARRRRRA